MRMNGYKKLLEAEINVYADRNKQSVIHRFNVLHKLRYMTFLLNIGAYTLLVTLSKRENDIDNILHSKFLLLLYGTFFSMFFFIIGVYLPQVLSDSISFLLFMVMIVIFAYAVYQITINPIHHSNQRQKTENAFEQSI